MLLSISSNNHPAAAAATGCVISGGLHFVSRRRNILNFIGAVVVAIVWVGKSIRERARLYYISLNWNLNQRAIVVLQ